MKTYVVMLEDHDDVISTRDKISWSKANRVLLVWPRRGRVLERRADLLILQRYAQSLGAQLAIVTASGQIRGNAHDLGIPVFAAPEKAQDVPWRRPRRRGRLRVHRLRMRRPVQDAFSLRQQLAQLKQTFNPSPIVRMLVFAVGILAFLSLVLLLLPGAEIHLVPERVSQQFTIQVWASPDIQSPSPNGGLPAQVVTVVVEGRDQASSTGQARIPDRPASGVVKLTNLTDQPVNLPAGSIVQTLNSPVARYITTRDVRVPGGPGQTISTTVQAEVPGQVGNLSAGKIGAVEGPLGLQLSVENLAPITGGRDRTGPSPAAADYRMLREKLLSDLSKTAEAEIKDLVSKGQLLMPGTVKLQSVIEETRQPEANQPGDQLLLGMRVEYQALVIQEVDLQAVAQAALDANLKEKYQPVPGSLGFVLSDTPVSGGSGAENARWELHVERDLAPLVTEANLLRAVQGRTISDACEILEAVLPLAQPPEVRAFPSWWPRLPFLPFRIELVSS